MFKLEMKGLNEFQKRLDDMAKRAHELDGKQQQVPLGELLNDGFMAKHSSFIAVEHKYPDDLGFAPEIADVWKLWRGNRVVSPDS
jgi:hypothetical protein